MVLLLFATRVTAYVGGHLSLFHAARQPDLFWIEIKWSVGGGGGGGLYLLKFQGTRH